MSTTRILKKIEEHWTKSLVTQGKNPLKHCIKSHYDWYKLYMEPDQEIDQYFGQIENSSEYTSLMERLHLITDIEKWVFQEKEYIYRQLMNIYP